MVSGKHQRLRLVITVLLLVLAASGILGVVVQAGFLSWWQPTPVYMQLAPLSDIGPQTCTPWPTCQYLVSTTVTTGGTTQVSTFTPTFPTGPVHVADFWQQWSDYDTGLQILSTAQSGVALQLTSASSRIIVLDLNEKLVSPLVSGPFVADPTLRYLCSASLTPSPLCMFDVLQFTPVVSVLINGNLVKRSTPGLLGSPIFVSFLDPAESSRNVRVYLWFSGASPVLTTPNSLVFDLRSYLSSFQTEQFTLTVNAFEHWVSYWLYYGLFQSISASNLGSVIATYLTSQYEIGQIDVRNQAQATYFWNFKFSSGVSGIPTGTYTAPTVPTASCGTSFGLPACTAPPATPTTTCFGPNCVASGGNGTTTTVGSGGVDPCNAFDKNSLWYSLCKNGSLWDQVCAKIPWLCATTFGIANWILLVVGIIGFILLIIIAKAIRGNIREKRAKE